MPDSYTYIGLLLASVFVPLVLSFDKKVAFYKRWKHLFPAIVISAAIFIVWDVWFTKEGVWSFNDQYILGNRIAGLPVEEWLFFIIIPFCCVFIYDVIKSYFPILKGKSVNFINYILSISLAVMLILNLGGLYTKVNFGFAIFLLIIFSGLSFLNKNKLAFYISFAISLVPFIIVNGILTALPVVSYNSSEIIGFRLFSIPVEDTVYLLSLLILNIGLYEWFQKPKATS